MTVIVKDISAPTEERLGVCHIALSLTSPDVALCGVVIPAEPWCCGARPSCGRPRCDSCAQAMIAEAS